MFFDTKNAIIKVAAKTDAVTEVLCMKIPPQNNDLRRYVRKKDIQRILFFLIWMALWIGGTAFYIHGNSSPTSPSLLHGWRMWVLLGAITVIGFFLFRIWKFFTDRSFEGTILTSDNLHDYSPSRDPGTMDGVHYDFRLNTAVRVLDTKGKQHRIRFEQKDRFYNYYYPGTHVVHLRGLPYPLRTDDTEGYLCAACGRIYDQKPHVCEACGHSLIDPRDLRPQ